MIEELLEGMLKIETTISPFEMKQMRLNAEKKFSSKRTMLRLFLYVIE